MSENVKVETNIYDICDEYFDCFVKTKFNSNTGEYDIEWSLDVPFEEEKGAKVYSDCFVQVLRNSITGKESVGWMQQSE